MKEHDHNHVAAHTHDHGHTHGHSHAHFEKADLPFIIGILLNIAFVITEISFGIMADSMALLTDAAHNVSDVLGLALAWWAASLARKKPTDKRTYGYRKAGILAALANATLILVAVGGIAWEAAMRIASPLETQGSNHPSGAPRRMRGTLSARRLGFGVTKRTSAQPVGECPFAPFF